MKLRPGEQARAFRSKDGKVFVVCDLDGMGLYYSEDDGGHYVQCYTRTVRPKQNMRSFTLDRLDPHSTRFRRYIDCRDGTILLYYYSERYFAVATPAQIEYEPLPIAYEHEYLCRLADGRLLYVSQRCIGSTWQLGDRRVYMGLAHDMRRLPVAVVKSGCQLPQQNCIEVPEGTLWLYPPPSWEPRSPNDKRRASTPAQQMYPSPEVGHSWARQIDQPEFAVEVTEDRAVIKF
jgi:hypothetical protein